MNEINNYDLSKRVEKLESENLMRQDTIACVDRAYDEQCENLLRRIKIIEDFIGQNYKVEMSELHQLNLKRIEDNTLISRRLTRVEEHFSGDYQLISSKISPHRCPICCGEGKFMHCGVLKMCECHSCEGKGVLWG